MKTHPHHSLHPSATKEDSACAPVFLFTCGPQAGGKELQKAVSSTREVLVWSGAAGVLNHLLESARQMDMAANPSVLGVLAAPGKKKTGKKAVPAGTDVRPIVSSLRLAPSLIWNAYRRVLLNLYQAPSRGHGFARWGLLETGVNKRTADILRLLFPDARFVFLLRHPFACLDEIRARKIQPRDRWGAIVTPARRQEWFAQQWLELAREFSQIDYGLKVRYEDLLEGGDALAQLGEYLELDGFPQKFSGHAAAVDRHNAPAEEARMSEAMMARLKPLLEEQMRRWSYA